MWETKDQKKQTKSQKYRKHSKNREVSPGEREKKSTVGMISAKDRFWDGSERVRELKPRKYKWGKQREEEKSQRWNEVDAVKEEAGCRDMVKQIETSNQYYS